MVETGESAGRRCANCDGPADELEEVRRVYLSVDGDGRVTGSETCAENEWWCLSCRTLYPHLPEGSAPDHPAPRPGPS
ncbi:MAG TPA: hypothetical protein VIJ09_06810 [Acidimicrobiales bacterium]